MSSDMQMAFKTKVNLGERSVYNEPVYATLNPYLQMQMRLHT